MAFLHFIFTNNNFFIRNLNNFDFIKISYHFNCPNLFPVCNIYRRKVAKFLIGEIASKVKDLRMPRIRQEVLCFYPLNGACLKFLLLKYSYLCCFHFACISCPHFGFSKHHLSSPHCVLEIFHVI